MTQWINKHKKVVARTLGILLLVGGIAALFWEKKDTALIEANKAAEANIKRMEASLPHSSGSVKKQESHSPYMKAYLQKQQEHLRYLVILAIIGGIVFLGYSFIKKKDDQTE